MTIEPPDADANRLDTVEGLGLYLDVAFKRGDPNYIADTLGLFARKHGMVSIAQQTGLNRENLYRALSARGNPRLATVMAVLRVMGLRLSVEPLGRK